MSDSLTSLSKDLALLDRTDRLDWLISQGDELPSLREEMISIRDSGAHGISECMAPVFFYVDRNEGRLSLYGDVPREAPIARGFLAFLITSYDGTVTEDFPTDMLEFLHLRECLSMQRQRGLAAIYQKLLEPLPLG